MRRVTRKIPAEILVNAQLKLDEVINMLGPYSAAVTPLERQTLVKIETEVFNFIERSHGLAVENPDLFPEFMKAEIFREEFFITSALWSLSNQINKLRDSISDSKAVAGNHTLQTALAFYQTVKIAARHDIPGARVIYEELKTSFYRGKRRQPRSV